MNIPVYSNDSGTSLSNATPARPRQILSANTPKPATNGEVVESTENPRPNLDNLSQWHTERPKPIAQDLSHIS